MAEKQSDDGALEELRQKLYSREGITRPLDRALKSRIPGPSEGWQHPEEPEQPMKKRTHSLSGAAVFFAASVAFFFIAAGVSAYLFLAGGRAVSTDNVIISVQGPTTSAAGETVPLLITIENKNPVPLLDSEFVVTFPDGTRAPNELTESLPRFVEGIGEIPAGGRVTRTVRAVLFGEEREILSMPMTLSYRTPASNAVFVKEKTYEMAMTSSPLSVSVSSVSEISVGQALTFSVLVRSNATVPLEDVALMVEYPFGFTEGEVSEAAVAPGVFPLGVIAPGAEYRFTLMGTLSGLEGDDRIFRFSAGTLDPSGRRLGLTYSSREQQVKIASPFLAAGLSLNGSEEDTVVVAPGTTVTASLVFENTLSTEIRDASIRIELSGDAIDRDSVRVSNGFYSSADAAILFTSETNQQLSVLRPGERGNTSFSFRVRTVEELGTLRNPSVGLRLSVSGRRTGEANVPEQLASTAMRTIKLASGITLTSDIVRTIGPFENSGPWPATPDLETTYTVRLGATNRVNSVAEAVVTTTIPSYVRFTGVTATAHGAVTFNESTREVRWNIGGLAPDVAASAAFQIAFLPSVSQRGATPILVTEQRLSAFDRYVQETVSGTAPALTTQLHNDPAYQPSFGAVGGN